MENSIYLGLSRQMTLRTNMDIIANNVANINTPGYRGQNLLFHEYISDPRGADDPLSFVYDEGQYQVTDPGPIKFTGNQLDMALAGPGFMGIVGPGGEIAYTRGGNFQLDAGGNIVTASGHALADAGGAAITVPPGTTKIAVDKNGNVSTQDGAIGQIMVVEFENIQELEALGHNLYRTDAATIPPENTTVNQGQLEGSNVKPVVEMTRMIDTLRSFQSVQNVLQTENERLRNAIQTLTNQG